MNLSDSRVAVALSAAAFIVAVGGVGAPALATVLFARDADKVDHKHAVGA